MTIHTISYKCESKKNPSEQEIIRIHLSTQFIGDMHFVKTENQTIGRAQGHFILKNNSFLEHSTKSVLPLSSHLISLLIYVFYFFSLMDHKYNIPGTCINVIFMNFQSI